MAYKKTVLAPVGASLVVLSSLFYASYGIWTKLMGNFFQGYTASALRSVLVLLFLLPIAIFYRQFEPVSFKKNWRYIAGMIVASLFTWGPLYYAVLHAGVGISLAIAYASIVLGSFFFGWLFGGECFTKDKAASACLGIIGLSLIFSPTKGHLALLALFGALVSGLSAGANTVFTKQIHYNAMQTTIVLWVTSIIGNCTMALVLKEHHPTVGLYTPWLYIVFFAIASVIASWSLVKGVKLIDAGAAGVLGLLEIVFGVLFGFLFFHEKLTTIVLIGIGVTIAAASIPFIRDYNLKKRSTMQSSP